MLQMLCWCYAVAVLVYIQHQGVNCVLFWCNPVLFWCNNLLVELRTRVAVVCCFGATRCVGDIKHQGVNCVLFWCNNLLVILCTRVAVVCPTCIHLHLG